MPRTSRLGLQVLGAALAISVVTQLGTAQTLDSHARVQHGAQTKSDLGDQVETLAMRLAVNPKGGVTVKRVNAGSDASYRGLTPGDVILRAGVEPIDTPADLIAAVDDAQHAGREAILLLIEHGGSRRFVTLRLALPTGVA